jgi:hypothetical protein
MVRPISFMQLYDKIVETLKQKKPIWSVRRIALFDQHDNTPPTLRPKKEFYTDFKLAAYI